MTVQAGQCIAVLAASDIPWLGRWRTLPGHEACEAGGHLWVRGPAGAEWDRLPALTRFTAADSGRLIPLGLTLPTARLPEGPVSYTHLDEYKRQTFHSNEYPGDAPG